MPTGPAVSLLGDPPAGPPTGALPVCSLCGFLRVVARCRGAGGITCVQPLHPPTIHPPPQAGRAAGSYLLPSAACLSFLLELPIFRGGFCLFRINLQESHECSGSEFQTLNTFSASVRGLSTLCVKSFPGRNRSLSVCPLVCAFYRCPFLPVSRVFLHSLGSTV